MPRHRQRDARARRIGLILFAACAVVAVPMLVILFSIAKKPSSPWFGQYDPDTQYVPFFNERFLGLTGPPADIGTTARAYGAFFRKAPAAGSDKDDYLIDHSTYTHLIDPEGNLRVLYRFEQLPETDKIAEDVQRVLGMPVAEKQP